MSWFRKPKPPVASNVERFKMGIEISIEHLANGSEMTELFKHAKDLLKTKFGNFGCEEQLDAAIHRFWAFMGSRMIGPTFNKAEYHEAVEALVYAILELAKAFNEQGLDIRPIFKPITDAIRKDVELVNMLET